MWYTWDHINYLVLRGFWFEEVIHIGKGRMGPKTIHLVQWGIPVLKECGLEWFWCSVLC